MSFTHLHLHTEYSLLDGAIRIKSLPSHIKARGMTACAITDHGYMYGVLDFYLACKAEGVKPIIGCEVYVAKHGYLKKSAEYRSAYSHLVLLAKNQEGFKNLNRLVSLACVEGFYYKPRIDEGLLEKYHEGLIVLSACLKGEVAQLLMSGDYEGAKKLALRYQAMLDEDSYYLEVQANGMREQIYINSQLRRLSDETGIPLVATADCHYLDQADAKNHDILLCVQTGKKLSDENRMRMSSDQLYIKTPEEMRRDLPDFLDAIDNTDKIAKRCNVEIELDKIHLPAFEIASGEASDIYMLNKVEELLDKYLREHSSLKESDETYKKRLEHEMSIIVQMGYCDYYLIVWDVIRYAREQDIIVGPGRGSGAGSLVAFLLGITSVDPLQYSLIFERFLNPERVSMPDFDTDICYVRRSELVDYIFQKYGSDRVAQVVTFGTLAARACLRDVGRAMDVDLSTVNRICKLVPAKPKMTLELAMKENPDLRLAYERDPSIKKLIDTSLLFEGMPRHASTHAAGIIISKNHLTNLVPLAQNDTNIVVQYSKDNIERVGLLKFDFLGLRTLTVLKDSKEMILHRHKLNIDYDNLDTNEKAVYEMIGRGDTTGVFQLESGGMTAFMMQLKPESIEDIIAGISLYRPGPMSFIPRYIQGRRDPKAIRYDHPALEPILNVTYGCTVYQEQVMQIVRDLAGFSMGQSDNVRKAMGKKKIEIIENYRQLFIHGGISENGTEVEGALKRGVSEQIASHIFDELVEFGKYAFNKSHAACYALIAYWTAWIKYHYPTEFMSAMLNSFLGNLSQATHYTTAAKEMGIEILPPDINKSEIKFQAEGERGIRFALAAVKNVGEAALENLLSERRTNGKFSSFGDFLRRAYSSKLNKKAVESLIKSSALDCFGVERNKMLAVYESFMSEYANSSKNSMLGQQSFFDMGYMEEAAEPEYPTLPQLPNKQLLAMEMEMTGVYISGHPLDEYINQIRKLKLLGSSILKVSYEDGDLAQEVDLHRPYPATVSKNVSLVAHILKASKKTSKKGNVYYELICEDLESSYRAMVFGEACSKYGFLFEEANILVLSGQVNDRDEQTEASFLVREACELAKFQPSSVELEKFKPSSVVSEQAEERIIVPKQGEEYSAGGRTQKQECNNIVNEALSKQEDINNVVEKTEKTQLMTSEDEVTREVKLTSTSSSKLILVIDFDGEINDSSYKVLTNTLAYYHGNMPVKLRMKNEEAFLPNICWIDPNVNVLEILAQRYGGDSLHLISYVHREG